jgi:hypothetical protein
VPLTPSYRSEIEGARARPGRRYVTQHTTPFHMGDSEGGRASLCPPGRTYSLSCCKPQQPRTPSSMWPFIRGFKGSTHTITTRHPCLPTPPQHTMTFCAPHAHPLYPQQWSLCHMGPCWFDCTGLMGLDKDATGRLSPWRNLVDQARRWFEEQEINKLAKKRLSKRLGMGLSKSPLLPTREEKPRAELRQAVSP